MGNPERTQRVQIGSRAIQLEVVGQARGLGIRLAALSYLTVREIAHRLSSRARGSAQLLNIRIEQGVTATQPSSDNR